MAKIPTMDEMAKQLAENALDNFLYDGKTLREWMMIIASEDAISRQAVLDMMQMKMSGKELYMAVHELPSVNPQPKTGHWIKHEHNGIAHIECSECLTWFLRPHLLRNSYCPNCGAKMKSEE